MTNKKTDIWMPVYIGDYMRDTFSLSFAQHGAYVLSMFAYWSKGSALTTEELQEVTKEHYDRVSKFYQPENGVMHHKRIDKELEAAKTKSIKARGSANTRWKDANAMRTQCERSASGVRSECSSPSPSPSYSDRDTRAREVELPHGFPKDENAAKSACMSLGCPESFAIDTWVKAVSRGGKDAKECPIRSFPHYLATEWKYEMQRQAKVKPTKPEPKQLKENLTAKML